MIHERKLMHDSEQSKFENVHGRISEDITMLWHGNSVGVHCTTQPPLSFVRFLRVPSTFMSPGIMNDCASSVSTMDTPDMDVMRDSLGFVRSPTDMSVSIIEMADCRTVSGRLLRLSVPALRRLEFGGETLLAIEAGRSLCVVFFRRTDVFRERRRWGEFGGVGDGVSLSGR